WPAGIARQKSAAGRITAVGGRAGLGDRVGAHGGEDIAHRAVVARLTKPPPLAPAGVTSVTNVTDQRGLLLRLLRWLRLLQRPRSQITIPCVSQVSALVAAMSTLTDADDLGLDLILAQARRQCPVIQRLAFDVGPGRLRQIM